MPIFGLLIDVTDAGSIENSEAVASRLPIVWNSIP